MQLPVIDESKQFSCNQCGVCCSHIRGMMPHEDRAFIEEMAFGKLPIVQLVPVDQMSLPLYDWEKDRFLQWAQEKNIDIDIKPLRCVFDLNTNTAIVTTYFIDATKCPMLQDNKCAIYDKKRAYICRLFPFNKSPFARTGEHMSKESLFGQCDQMNKLMTHVPGEYEKMLQFLSKAFPDQSFENAVEYDYINEWVNKTVIELMRNKQIRPAINYPYQMLLKRIENANKMDLTEFLESVGYVESRDQLIREFDENKHAQEIIAEKIPTS